ncbi:MAG TPA: hypothetical protein VJH20_04585 [Candidatus Nanoarchaeia archaeon]|nr:hypothetical protein [Candidatus Nanoarchaeia archaeon]
MRCIICNKRIPEDCELCMQCSDIIDVLYKDRLFEKKIALSLFRKYARRNK